ncbi:MAG: DUF4292 domain-containing protein [Prevotellaceae bacterium]|nr:DUF4292 domain-containing protein [Prevotellaceae bacterium]
MKKYIYISAIIMIALTGCKTKQNTTKPAPISTSNEQTLTAENIVNQVINQQKEISFVNISNAETSLNYNEKNVNVKFSIKIVKDKDITISVLPLLGIEMFRLQLTPKKFYIFDRLHRQYCENNYDIFKENFGTEISYETIEALLLNRLFSLNGVEKSVLKKAFTAEQKTEKYLLKSVKKVENFEHRFEISPDFKITGTFLNQNSLDAVSLNYSNFEAKNGIVFPQKIDAKIVSPTHNLNVVFDIKKMELNKAFEMSETDLSRYTKVDCSTILPL